MATASNLPGRLSIACRRGDEYGTIVDFSIDVTDYAFASQVYSLSTGATVVAPAVTVVNAASGQINVAMTESQTSALSAGTYGFRIEWLAPGSVKRTALDGFAEITA